MLVTVDTGGTKTLIAQFKQDGTITSRLKFPTPPSQTEYVTLLKKTLKEHFGNDTIEALVIALPGIVKDGVAVWCNNLGWKNFDARRAFTGVLGDALVFIENDANLAGLAEMRVLHPMPASALYVTISTGIGTGIITNGHIDPGLRYSEGGRTLIEFEGKIQEWEDFASGKAIHEIYGMYARDITSKTIWNEIADRISRGFLAFVPVLQPDTVIIGGSIGTYFDRYGVQLESILRSKLPDHIPCPTFKPATHPEEAVVYGGYYFALDSLTNN